MCERFKVETLVHFRLEGGALDEESPRGAVVLGWGI